MALTAKKQLQEASFVIDGNAGEKYYQVHIFEDLGGLNRIQVSSKINKRGEIEIFSRGSKGNQHFTATITKASSKEEFQKGIDFLKKDLEAKGFVHNFVDLSHCNDLEEALILLKKTFPKIFIEIKNRASN